jgi:hypothetical protein
MSDKDEVDGSLPDDDYEQANAEIDEMEEDEDGPEISYETEDEEAGEVRFFASLGKIRARRLKCIRGACSTLDRNVL